MYWPRVPLPVFILRESSRGVSGGFERRERGGPTRRQPVRSHFSGLHSEREREGTYRRDTEDLVTDVPLYEGGLSPSDDDAAEVTLGYGWDLVEEAERDRAHALPADGVESGGVDLDEELIARGRGDGVSGGEGERGRGWSPRREYPCLLCLWCRLRGHGEER